METEPTNIKSSSGKNGEIKIHQHREGTGHMREGEKEAMCSLLQKRRENNQHIK